jgi:hypothetical protein
MDFAILTIAKPDGLFWSPPYEYMAEDFCSTLVFSEDGSVIFGNVEAFEYKEEGGKVIVYDNSGNNKSFVLNKQFENGELALHLKVDLDWIPLLDEMLFVKSQD